MSEVKEELQKVEDIVKDILEKYPDARENDHLLYYIYVKRYMKKEFQAKVFVYYKKYKLASFEGVSRARRNIQSKYEHLISEETRQKRLKKEQELRKIYREHQLGAII